MSLYETLRIRLKDAMKTGKECEKSILRVVLGDVSMLEGRGQKITDAEIQKIIKKIVQGNEETVKFSNPEIAEKLNQELEILRSFLPKTLNKEEIKANLDEIVFMEIRNSKSDGQGTGILMKHMKSKDLIVDGVAAGEVAKEIRTFQPEKVN